jgi:hypothetical protein
MAGLSQFLTQMANNPQVQRQFTNDPYATMSAAGLSTTEMTAILSKNPGAIHSALGTTAAADAETVIVVIL